MSTYIILIILKVQYYFIKSYLSNPYFVVYVNQRLEKGFNTL